jgi:glycosyltransferase involved in cell wall biosynthesis
MTRIVAIDGHNLALPQGTGVATYARNLADNVDEMGWDVWTLYGAPISHRLSPLLREIYFFDFLGGAKSSSNKFSKVSGWVKHAVTSPFGYQAHNVQLSGNVETRRFIDRLPRKSDIFNIDSLFSISRQYFKRHRKFLEIRFQNPPDVMHWTYPLPIRVAGIPNIYTIHDLVPLRLPYTTLDNRRYYYRLIKHCVTTGDHICTVSERSKRDIVRMFGTSESMITNTYQAVETEREVAGKSQDDAELEVLGIYGLKPQSYFLFFGAIEPKKNVGRLIEAFLSTQVNARLVIVGAPAWKSDEEMKLLGSILKQRRNLRNRVQIFDYAPRPFLISLIRAAKAVVFPSLYEGFGLPVLEAMQLGTPTLCSSEGALPEIVGDASLSVDPYDVKSIAAGLRTLDDDGDVRRGLVAAGFERAKLFGSAAYQGRLLNMYQRDF